MICYIMRGIPGSGKSSVARNLGGVIHSTDSYFMVNGEYKFDPTRLAEYHAANLADFEASCKSQKSTVICDNTNIRKEHYEPYVRIAEKYGYVVHVLIVDCDVQTAYQRCSHSVPIETIQRMKEDLCL